MTIEEMKKLAEDAMAGLVNVHCDEGAVDWFEKYSNSEKDAVPVVLGFVPEAIEVMKVMAEALHSVLRFEDGRANPNKVIVREIRESLAAYRKIGGV